MDVKIGQTDAAVIIDTIHKIPRVLFENPAFRGDILPLQNYRSSRSDNNDRTNHGVESAFEKRQPDRIVRFRRNMGKQSQLSSQKQPETAAQQLHSTRKVAKSNCRKNADIQ